MSIPLPVLSPAGGDILQEWPGLQIPKNLDLHQLLDALCISPLAPPCVLEVARRAHAIPYPPHWSEQLDAASGVLYFYHGLRDDSSWEHPLTETFRDVLALVGLFEAERVPLDALAERIEQDLMEAQRRATEALADWVGPIGCSGAADSVYFFNRRTGQSEWQDPRELWQFDLHVRYNLLVGFMVAEEKRMAKAFAPQALLTLTSTLTSLASSLSSVQSVLNGALAAPASVDYRESSQACWARPRTHKVGGLPLPPRTASVNGRNALDQALFSMPSHQRRYASDVLQQQEQHVREATRPSSSGSVVPPPPPLEAAPRFGRAGS